MRVRVREMRKKWMLLLAVVIIGATGCSLKDLSTFDDAEATKTELGMQSIKNLDSDTAFKMFEEAITAGEVLELIYRGQGMAYMCTADYKTAISCFEKALGEADGKVTDLEYDISYYLANAEYKSGDLSGAEDTYTAMLNMRNKDSDAYYLRGTVELEQDLYDKAIRDFNAAVDNDPSNPDLFIKIYECMAKNKYKEEGHDYLDQAMALDTKISDFQKGKLYYCLEDYENARNSLEKARSEEEDEVVLYLGKTYEALGDMNYAASLYKNYLEKNPEDVVVYNQLGLCQLQGGYYEDALMAFEKGIAIENNDIMQSLQYNEIVTYEYLSDFKKAAVLMEAYLKAYPDDQVAKRENEFLKTR